MTLNNDIVLLVSSLEEANRKEYSYQCPYLALADVLGYNTPYNIHHLPSRFGRLSVRKMLLTSGIDIKLAKLVWLMLEDGYTLNQIALEMRYKYGY